MYFPDECENVGVAARRDGLTPVVSASNSPAQGLSVALVVWPGEDYHWYRLDSNGKWSHKPGSSPVRNRDDSNKLITDPETCDTGPYNWCGYYHSIPANIRIR